MTFGWHSKGDFVTPLVKTAQQRSTIIFRRPFLINRLLWRKTVLYFLSFIVEFHLCLKSRNECIQRTWGLQPFRTPVDSSIGAENFSFLFFPRLSNYWDVKLFPHHKLDDVIHYRSGAALHVVEQSPQMVFQILLKHSPQLVWAAFLIFRLNFSCNRVFLNCEVVFNLTILKLNMCLVVEYICQSGINQCAFLVQLQFPARYRNLVMRVAPHPLGRWVLRGTHSGFVSRLWWSHVRVRSSRAVFSRLNVSTYQMPQSLRSLTRLDVPASRSEEQCQTAVNCNCFRCVWKEEVWAQQTWRKVRVYL